MKKIFSITKDSSQPTEIVSAVYGTKFVVLSACYLTLMSVVWIVALLVGDHVHLHHPLAHFIGFVSIGAIIFVTLKKVEKNNALPVISIGAGKHTWLLALVPIALIVIYIILLGNIPLLDAIRANEYYAVTRIRTDISKSGFPESYIPALVTRSIAPALTIYFLHKNNLKLAFATALSAMMIGLLTITKGHIVFASVPVVLYCLLTRRFYQTLLFAATALVMIYCVMVVTNPATKSADKFATSSSPIQTIAPTTVTTDTGAPSMQSFVVALMRRSVMVPGQVVSEWFETFPMKVPFEQGCGYRFIARIAGCEFKKNAALVYSIYFPERTAQGILGSKNAAHFMEEYANFGVPGLFLAGALAAIAISFATIMMGRINMAAFLSLNLVFVLMLASTALHTTLLSGGWLAAMIVSAVLVGSRRRQRKNWKAAGAQSWLSRA